MALTNAERQRRFRAKRDADPQKREVYLKKGLERYRNECLTGKRKPITELTEREKRSVRKRWRSQKRKDRARVKKAQKILETVQTPPSSADEQQSHQKKGSQKKRRREEAKVYRDKKKLETEIKNLKKKVDMYKKRLHRQVEQSKQDTPRKRTRKLLRHLTPKEAKRSLFKCQVFIEAIRAKYKAKRKAEKADIRKFLCNQTLKKYHLKTEAQRCIGYNSPKKKRTRLQTLTKRESQKVFDFYTRNDNSRLIPGKRQTKTLKKTRKQRRVLLYDIKTLHKKFLSEGKTQISYTSFCRLRPFFVVFPRQSDRNTCMCKTCNNTEMIAEALKQVNVIESDDLNVLLSSQVCTMSSKMCMYGECTKCKGRSLTVDKENLEKDVTWSEWKTKKEIRKIQKSKSITEKTITITVKESQTGPAEGLIDKFEEQLRRYSKHTYRVFNQYEYFAKRKETMNDDECIIHVDFSENYVCGYSAEIQSVHFGGSKKQLTLHTGVAHIKQEDPFTFCTVSDSLVHGPEAVWAHLTPILTEILRKYPKVKNLEIFSDGPVTQYRQKANFYLATRKVESYGFHNVLWSFFESGHGKGIPDAIGGALKRQADNKVKYGSDITSAMTFIEALSKDSKVSMYLVTESDIQEVKDLLNTPLKPVPGTLSLHQVKIISEGQIAFRNLSCECKIGVEHKGHEYQKVSLIEEKDTESTTITDNGTKGLKQSRDEDTKSTKCPKRRKVMPNVRKMQQPRANDIKTEHINNKPCNSKYSTNKEQYVEDYEDLLRHLNKCKTFTRVGDHLSELKDIICKVKADEISIYENKLEVDFDAAVDMPGDLDRSDLYPVEVMADGNCLPSCGSVFAFGTTEDTEEIRTRIIKELCDNECTYLSNEFLNRGCSSKKNLTKHYAQYSEFFIPGMNLDQDIIKDIFRKETMSLTQNRSFMGIWQLFALSSVLSVPIRSVYPEKGNPNVRQDLNRLILPRTETKSEVIYILWTNTRDDITESNWVPNHFVPLLPFNHDRRSDVNNNDYAYNLKDNVAKIENTGANGEKNGGAKNGDTDDKNDAKDDKGSDQSEQNDDKSEKNGDDNKRNGDERDTNDNTNVEHGEKSKDIGEKDEQVNDKSEKKYCCEEMKDSASTKNEKKSDDKNEYFVPDIHDCLNRYVIVNFNGRPYPGHVKDIENQEVEIMCMHQVGTKKASNCFFWPQKIKDLSWYDYTDIMTVIPDPFPVPNSRHFTINEALFKAALSKCKK